MKKVIEGNICHLLILVLCFILFSPTVSNATDSQRSYNLRLSVDGDNNTIVNVGDEITLQVKLERRDEGKKGSYALYAMQDEIIYDGSYFTLIENSKIIETGYDFNIGLMEDGIRQRIVLSRVVGAHQPQGVETEDSLVIATFKLKVISGRDEDIGIISRDYKISTEDSTTTDTITSNNVTVTISSSTVPTYYAVIFKGGTGATGTAPSMGDKEKGEKFTLPDNTFRRSGYNFTGWNDGTKTYRAGDTYTISGHAVTFTAQWEKETGGGTPPGGGTAPSNQPEKPKPEDDKPILKVPVTMKGTAATITIEEHELDEFLTGKIVAGPVTLDFGTDAQSITTLGIPGSMLQIINEAAQTGEKKVESLKIPMAKGEIEFSAAALDTVTKAAGTAELEVTLEEAIGLTVEQRAIVKDAPVYNISVESKGKKIDQFDGEVTIYLPYTLKAGQSSDGVVVYYVGDDGELIDMKAKYDPVKKVAYFTTTHLSVYIVDYKEAEKLDGPSARYVDVAQDAWYREAVDFALQKGLFVGTSDTTFEPNTAMSRAMLVTVLWRLEGEPAVSLTDIFKDVVKGAWYEKAVDWASANQIVSGYGDGVFGPDDNISREQMAAILYRYAELKNYDVIATGSLTAFTDAGDISSWAVKEIKWAVAEGLISGMTESTLAPTGNATRAQVATILMRFVENVVE